MANFVNMLQNLLNFHRKSNIFFVEMVHLDCGGPLRPCPHNNSKCINFKHLSNLQGRPIMVQSGKLVIPAKMFTIFAIVKIGNFFPAESCKA